MSSKQINSGNRVPGQRRHIIGRLMGYIKREYKARFTIVLVCILVSAIANVAGSLFLGSLIDDYITPLLGAADPDFSGLVRALVMMGCLFLVGALCAYAYNRNMIVVSQGVQKTIRDDLFGAAVRKTGDRDPVAYSVFIDPPLSHIGITEETARRNNLDVRVNRIAVASIPRMRTIGETDGLLKAVIDARTNRILGCTLFCPESSEVINTVAVAMKSGRTAALLRDFVFTRPSVSEALNDRFV